MPVWEILDGGAVVEAKTVTWDAEGVATYKDYADSGSGLVEVV